MYLIANLVVENEGGTTTLVGGKTNTQSLVFWVVGLSQTKNDIPFSFPNNDFQFVCLQEHASLA